MADTPGLNHPDSIDSQDPNAQPEDKKAKSRRPANTAFRQQRLKAWQPILTPKTVLPLFFAIGIVFAPIGGGLLFASNVVQEIIMDYSHCHTDAPIWPETGRMPKAGFESHFAKNKSFTDTNPGDLTPFWSRRNITNTTQTIFDGKPYPHAMWECQLNFTIENNMDPPVYFYYRLTNFYQNHRRYAKSFNTAQLSGEAVSAGSVHSSDCDPLHTAIDPKDGKEKPYYPCGLAANSVFNDTFANPLRLGAANDPVPYNMTTKGIAWASDRELYGETKYNLEDVLPPVNWQGRYPDGYTATNKPDLANDEAFQVWMRLAGLPTFSKLAQKNTDTVMNQGSYTVSVNSFFNVTEYGGTKSIIISTGTIMGGRNPFLGIAYVVVGGLCIVLGALFTVTHLVKPRKLGDHTYLSWNNDNSHNSGSEGVLGADRS
ncbi:ligand-effect modulator 3 family [Amylocarpus encephaloides]|uniref:Ligand-effect modulator 3 family n=1 Tax=Amylocarpus encephaloides TaxID=45428 RepID=A0A9P8C945_9HELO|nr:ligand-effect modulator 3 family [Amylocarpus encephaloides]